MQRRDEILAKKAKLAELKRQRELRQKEFSATRQSITSSADINRGSPGRAESKEEVDSLVSSLIGDKATASPRTPRTPSGRDRSRAASSGRGDSGQKDGRSSSPNGGFVSNGTQTLSLAPLKTVYEVRSAPARKEAITYSKGVQTSPPPRRRTSRSSSSSSSSSELRTREIRDGEGSPKRSPTRRKKEREEELRQNIRREIEDELSSLQQGGVEATLAQDGTKKQNFPARTLNHEEQDAVTSSNDFLDFVERSSKVIERALDEEYDVLADYRLGTLSGPDDDDDVGASTGRRGRRVREIMQFYDEKWSKRRMISDIGFSPKFPELVLSSHTKNASSPYEPPGVIQIWNTHMHGRPEYIFHANSDILTAQFSPFHPNLILGGTYSGQVLLWDTRSRASQHQPVQKTPLTGTGFGHTHPIYNINVIGTQNAHNIISTSTDGVVCSWSIDMLSHPQEYLELTAPPPSSFPNNNASSSNPVTNSAHNTLGAIAPSPYNVPSTLSPTATAFPPTDPTYFLCGTEAGPIHLIHRYERAGSKAGVDASLTYTGHAAPVMSLDFHKATGPMDLGDLMLSTGLDWCVRLWRVRTPGSLGYAAGASSGGGGAEAAAARRRDVLPLLEIQRDEPIYDAKWSPVRPGVWASVDGAGHLEVWDLNAEVEVPVARVTPSQRVEDGVAVPPGQARSLNKCAWEMGEGRRIAVGGVDGVVTVFEVGGELGGVEGVRQEEWMGVKKLVARLEGGGR